MTELAEILLEKEVIFSDDLEKIFGKRPWKTEEELPESPSKEATKPKAVKAAESTKTEEKKP